MEQAYAGEEKEKMGQWPAGLKIEREGERSKEILLLIFLFQSKCKYDPHQIQIEF